MGREERNSAVEIARQEKNRWKKRALRAEATLARVREVYDAWLPREAEMWVDLLLSDILDALDESPTERETPAKPEGWARCNANAFHSKSAAYAAGYMNGWDARGGGSR